MLLTWNPGLLALSVWLILVGLLPLLNPSFPASGIMTILKRSPQTLEDHVTFIPRRQT